MVWVLPALHMENSPRRHSEHLPQVVTQAAITRSPGWKRVTPSPRAWTVPTASWPIGRPWGRTAPGKRTVTSSLGNSSRKCMSLPQMVDIDILTTISPGPGWGGAISSISIFPLAGFTAASMGGSSLALGSGSAQSEHTLTGRVKGQVDSGQWTVDSGQWTVDSGRQIYSAH